MSIESYKNYTVRGFAKQLGDGSFEAFGTVQIISFWRRQSLWVTTQRTTWLWQQASHGRKRGSRTNADPS